MELGLHRGIPNEVYHAVLEGDEVSYSSSQLKNALDDIETFYKLYVTKELKSKHIAAFDIGTYFHTAILEPHLLDVECAVWTGDRRAGKAYEAFKAENEGKAIITMKEKDKADNLINATKESPIAMEILSKGEPELSLIQMFCGVKCKVRADNLYLCPVDVEGESHLSDLKSTTGNVKDVRGIQGKISSYSYDLSAAFYLDMFNKYIEGHNTMVRKKEIEGVQYKIIKKFYWIFASKDMANCKTYYASEKCLRVGRIKYIKAINLIRTYKEMDWEFVDFMEAIEPSFFDEEWLQVDPNNLEIPKPTKNKKVDAVKQTSVEDIL